MVDGYVGTVETERLGDSLWVLKLAEHDLSTAPAIGEALRRIGECGTTVVVDLTQTSFIDSTVIGALVGSGPRRDPAAGGTGSWEAQKGARSGRDDAPHASVRDAR